MGAAEITPAKEVIWQIINPPGTETHAIQPIGLDHVLTVLEALCEEYREERYRPAPALRRLVGAGRLGRASGAGFFEHKRRVDLA